jgi:cysteine desulfurase
MFPKLKKPKNSIYLDYAATTPVDPGVLKAMRPFWNERFGNPSSLYRQGIEARQAVETSRKKIAEVIGARAAEIIFTAGGTESCNLAIFGVAKNFKPTKKYRPHIITSAIEHHAVLNPVKELAGEGYDVTFLDVDRDGLINIRDLQKAIRSETALVSIMYANNEIGTIEPIAEAGKWLARINIDRAKNKLPAIVFHTDACQAAGSLDLNVHRLGVDLMSANGSKIYGLKQTGFLFVKGGVNLKPLIFGGGQEKDLRSGTENVPGIVGLAKALELAKKIGKSENRKIGQIQKYFIEKLMGIDGVELNGPDIGPKTPFGRSKSFSRRESSARLSNNINITIRGVEGEALMLYLDSYGIAVSTGSACTTGLSDPSHVLLAIGRSPQEAKSSIRLTMGRQTTKQQIDYVFKVLPALIKELRKV